MIFRKLKMMNKPQNDHAVGCPLERRVSCRRCKRNVPSADAVYHDAWEQLCPECHAKVMKEYASYSIKLPIRAEQPDDDEEWSRAGCSCHICAPCSHCVGS